MTFLSDGTALSGTSPNGQYPALKPAALQPAVAPAIVPATPDPPERLYALLPAIYRLRDAQGEPLRALLAIIESELRAIEADIEALYENWFIETCEEWVVPYIGDLLAVRDLNAAGSRQFGQERRAYVANTLFYRQRKGTTPVLEQLARDITGWGVRAVESLQLVATTQNINHLRPQAQTALLRPPRRTEISDEAEEPLTNPALALLASPFETAVAYTTQIRPNRGDRIRYNPASVALYLWQLQIYQIENATPRAVRADDAEPQGYCFTFNPLGSDRIPLFNLPQAETELTTLAQEENVPGILTRELLRKLLKTRDRACLPVQVFVNDKPQPFEVKDLSEWGSIQDSSKWGSTVPLAIDPERGRLKFQTAEPPENVTVSYVEGFSGDIGAGAYERPDPITEQPPVSGQITLKVQSSADLASEVKTWNQNARKWQRCYDLVNFPVARLAMTPNGLQPIEDDAEPPKMQAGILRGLQAIVRKGEIDVVVVPGIAIDRNGQTIQLNARHCVNVGCYPNQTILLVIAHLTWQPYWNIQAVPQQNGQYDLADGAIPLVELKIDADGRLAQSRSSVREAFQPGFVGQFEVSILLSAGSPLLSLSPSPDAFAVNRKGQKIRLDRVATLTLPPEPPQTILLFIAPSKPTETGKLDIVPDTDRIIIELQGNRTLTGNLALQIPAEKRLYLVASNGDRPHLIGNIALRGMATPETENGGDFFLEGLLVEGGLTVLPGNLQRLQIHNSTLVPAAGGLSAQKAEYEIVDEDLDEVTLLAMLIYSLTLLRRLLQVGLANNSLTTLERISQMTQIAQQQILTLLEGVRYVWQRSHRPPEEPKDEEDAPTGWAVCQPPAEPISLDEDNSFLTIRIARSICGSITLADTVPTLSIIDSIIDSNLDAIGSDVDIQKSTLLGAVQTNSLSADASIFVEQITVSRRQSGCLRFCYVPVGSQTPRRYRCQPDLLLAEQVGELPAAIATLAVHPITPQIYAGTASGVLRFLEASNQWVPLNGLDPLNITALLAIATPGTGSVSGDRTSPLLTGTLTRFTQELQPGDTIFLLGQPHVVLEVRSDQELRLGAAIDLPPGTPFAIDTLLAGTADGKLLRATPLLKSGTGTLSSMNSGGTLVGCGTNFTAELVGGNLTIANQRHEIISVESPTQLTLNPPFPQDITDEVYLFTAKDMLPKLGQGTVSNSRDRTRVVGCRTRFRQEVEIGDDILLVDAGGAVVETRTVTAIESDRVLSINAAFTRDRIEQKFLLRRTSWKSVQPSAEAVPNLNTRINTLVYFEHTNELTGILAGTAGNGILRSTDGGNHWQAVNQGLTHLNVQAIANYGSNLLAGTDGNGVLRSSDHGLTWTGGDPIDPEVRQTGLTVPNVTSFAINPLNNDIFVGTGGGVFRSSDGGDRWTAMNQGLLHSTITALIGFTQAGTGTLSSRHTVVSGQDTNFHGEFQVGDTLTLNGQTRTITRISEDPNVQQLTLNDAFDPDLPAGTRFQRFTLLAGATNGAVYRSTSNGKTWQAIATLTKTDISTFAVQPSEDAPILFAGTQLGSLYRSQPTKAEVSDRPPIQRGDQWNAISSGIPGIEATLVLINQMQPRFTSERYGEPTYAQLSSICPIEIRTGTEDGSEMGVFNFLKQPQREANLQSSLREYLRFGLQADILYRSYSLNGTVDDPEAAQ